jgi:twinkle protein
VVVDVSINQGTLILAASLEYRAAKWLHRLSTIACGVDNPTDEFRRACFRRLSNNLMVFDVPQSAKAKRIMEVFRYASKRYGVKLFLIDNLTKCGFDDDDYSGQKNFVEELSDFARTENVHIAIVMHMRKGETGEEKPSGKFGFKGSGGITDMASTVIEVWRNKKKEKEALKAETTGVPSPEAEKPDTYLFVHKQRESGFEPTIALWFNQKTLQFLGASHHKPSTIGGMIKMADGR